MGKPKAQVDGKKCFMCSGCVAVCQQDAVSIQGGKAYVDVELCTGCKLCVNTCPVGAIQLLEVAVL